MSEEIPKYGNGIRGSWVFRDGKLIPREIAGVKQVEAPYVWKDEVDAFENPVTGEMETSMSTYRRKLKEMGYFEKGTDRMKYQLPSFNERYADVRESALEAERQIKWGMAKSTSEEREKWERQNRERKRRA